MTRRRSALLGVALVTLALSPASGARAADADPTCVSGTPSALRFADLPARIAYGADHEFSLAEGDTDWSVAGPVHVRMQVGGTVVFEGDTDDPYAAFYLQLDRGDPEATITATFSQTGYPDATGSYDAVTCIETITATVAGFVPPMRLVCNKWTGDGDNIAYRTIEPRKCSVWRENWSHAQSASFVRAKWRHWGRSVAYARAVLVYNMGYRARIRVKAYRPRLDCTGRFLVYTRVYIKGPDGRGTVKPDTCV